MLKFIFITSFLLVQTGFITAQNLLDSAKVQINLRNYQSAIYINDFIANNSTDKQEIGDAFFSSGYCYKKLNDPVKAVDSYLQTLNYYRSSADKSSSFNNIGNIFVSAHLYENAIDFLSRAVQIENDSLYLARTLLNRAIAYKRINNYDSATLDILKANEIAIRLENQSLTYRCENQLGLIKKDVEMYDEAIKHFENANRLEISKKTFVNLANTYKEKGDVQLAINYYKRAIGYTKRIHTKFIAFKDLGDLHLEQGELDKAYKNLFQASLLYQELTAPELEEIRVFKSLAIYYQEINQEHLAIENFRHSYDLLEKFVSIKEELTRKFTKDALLKTLSAFETRNIMNENRQEYQLTLSSVIFITLSIISILAFILRKTKLGIKQKESALIKLKTTIKLTNRKFI